MIQQQEQAIERIGKELRLLFSDMYGSIQFHMNPEIQEVRVKFVKDIRFKEKKR